MKNLTIEKAYELCLLKWEYIVKNNGDNTGLLDAHPELEELKSECAYCELFTQGNQNCDGCPINMNLKGYLKCTIAPHPWKKWYNDPTKRNAKAVLDLIIKTKP